MRFFQIYLIIILLALNFFSCKAELPNESIIVSISDTLRVSTYNVRIKTSGDTNERAWTQRKVSVAQLINNYKFDVFGVQELVNLDQENDLQKLLPSFNSISKGRDNNQGTSGERLGIFYNKNRFLEKENGSFFLSSTPDVVSKGWDAALNRMCIWIKLHDKVLQKDFYFFNAHFDHVGITARAESAALIITKINEIAGHETVFCVGDFNASPLEIAVYDKLAKEFTDSRTAVKSENENSVGTFNNWDITKNYFPESVRIDYIFTSKVRILTYNVIADKYVPETYPSDHFPVMIQCLIE